MTKFGISIKGGVCMFETEEKIRKPIIAPDGEDEFQIRYISDENVGLLTARSGKSYLILDSIDYWYDLIQEKYPPKRKCKCKNDYFKLYFDYVPRVGSDDYRAVELFSCCTECGNERNFASVDIDYSPTNQLFEQPITYCETPNIKYKTYSARGYWSEEAFYGLVDFLSKQPLMIYCWYNLNGERHIERLSAHELKKLLFEEKANYLNIYFSAESLENEIKFSEGYGFYYIDQDVWRKKELIDLHGPLTVAGFGLFYSMDFCSEYIEKGCIKAKSAGFSQIVQQVCEYCRENLG